MFVGSVRDAQRLRLWAVGELANCPPGTEAKFINELPRGRAIEVSGGKKFYFQFDEKP